MRQTLYVLVDDNGLADQMVGCVTDDPKIADLWIEHGMGHVEKLELNRVALTVDARSRFFRCARRVNNGIAK